MVHLKRSDTRLVKHGFGEQIRRGMRSTAVNSRKSLQVVPNDRQKVQISVSGVRPKPQQRVLGDFFGTLPPIMAAQSPVSNKGSNDSFSAPNTAHPLTPEQNCDLPLDAEAQPQIPADKEVLNYPPLFLTTPIPRRRLPVFPPGVLTQNR